MERCREEDSRSCDLDIFAIQSDINGGEWYPNQAESRKQQTPNAMAKQWSSINIVERKNDRSDTFVRSDRHAFFRDNFIIINTIAFDIILHL